MNLQIIFLDVFQGRSRAIDLIRKYKDDHCPSSEKGGDNHEEFIRAIAP